MTISVVDRSDAIVCDLAIIGGGLTGLSLACWLEQTARIAGQSLPSVFVLEPRARYENDRTWSFWDLEQHPFSDVISHRWPRWQAIAGDRSVTQDGGQQGYAMLSADTVYHQALTTINASSQLNLCQNTRVQSIAVDKDEVLVSTDTQQWRAQAVVDTRPPEPAQMKSESGLWQLFTGFEIDCPAHGYPLDTVHLMDFQVGNNTISFIYLLPLGANQLLVEWTEFLPEWRSPAFEPQLTAWLNANLKRPFHLLRHESGALPMMEVANCLTPGRVVNAGIRGGWMRPSSGFHFAACQRGCKALAAQILTAHQTGQWTLRSPTLRHPGIRWMDRVFLKALRQTPQHAHLWFMAMFAGTSAAQMSRFMNDQPTITDLLAIVRTLPPGPLIKAALT